MRSRTREAEALLDVVGLGAVSVAEWRRRNAQSSFSH